MPAPKSHYWPTTEWEQDPGPKGDFRVLRLPLHHRCAQGFRFGALGWQAWGYHKDKSFKPIPDKLLRQTLTKQS